MSIILRPAFDVSRSVLVTAAGAVAVAEAVDEVCGQNAQIKWVNDVYVDGRKVCGVLTEGITDFETGQIDSLILGIGINTSLTDFPDELLDIVGAVEGDYSRPALAAAVIAKALTFTDHLDEGAFMPAYKERSLVIGRDVTVYQGKYRVNPEDEVHGRKARVLDIDDDGGLVVLYADGTQERLVSGEITLRL